MQNKIIFFTVFLIFCLLKGDICFGANFAKPRTFEANSYFYAPAGITCDAILSENINSSSTVVGQQISVILINDLKYKNTVIASSGSTITGTITQNQVAGMGSDVSKLRIRFTSIRTLYNNVIPVSATVLTKDKTGYIVAQNKDKDDNKVVLSANSKINLLFDQPITVTAQ